MPGGQWVVAGDHDRSDAGQPCRSPPHPSLRVVPDRSCRPYPQRSGRCSSSKTAFLSGVFRQERTARPRTRMPLPARCCVGSLNALAPASIHGRFQLIFHPNLVANPQQPIDRAFGESHAFTLPDPTNPASPKSNEKLPALRQGIRHIDGQWSSACDPSRKALRTAGQNPPEYFFSQPHARRSQHQRPFGGIANEMKAEILLVAFQQGIVAQCTAYQHQAAGAGTVSTPGPVLDRARR